uniref:Uncharacterized protein n=1 Tax=Timema cristinae TaxID=61476 RepID=A0A7R9CMN3_TIMCR|nr:unnamed protein product [Timema cristinae]
MEQRRKSFLGQRRSTSQPVRSEKDESRPLTRPGAMRGLREMYPPRQHLGAIPRRSGVQQLAIDGNKENWLRLRNVRPCARTLWAGSHEETPDSRHQLERLNGTIDVSGIHELPQETPLALVKKRRSRFTNDENKCEYVSKYCRIPVPIKTINKDDNKSKLKNSTPKSNIKQTIRTVHQRSAVHSDVSSFVQEDTNHHPESSSQNTVLSHSKQDINYLAGMNHVNDKENLDSIADNCEQIIDNTIELIREHELNINSSLDELTSSPIIEKACSDLDLMRQEHSLYNNTPRFTTKPPEEPILKNIFPVHRYGKLTLQPPEEPTLILTDNMLKLLSNRHTTASSSSTVPSVPLTNVTEFNTVSSNNINTTTKSFDMLPKTNVVNTSVQDTADSLCNSQNVELSYGPLMKSEQRNNSTSSSENDNTYLADCFNSTVVNMPPTLNQNIGGSEIKSNTTEEKQVASSGELSNRVVLDRQTVEMISNKLKEVTNLLNTALLINTEKSHGNKTKRCSSESNVEATPLRRSLRLLSKPSENGDMSLTNMLLKPETPLKSAIKKPTTSAAGKNKVKFSNLGQRSLKTRQLTPKLQTPKKIDMNTPARKRQANEMLQRSNKNFPPVSIGQNNLIKLPEVERGCAAPRNVTAVVMEWKVELDLYHLGTSSGVLQRGTIQTARQQTARQAIKNIWKAGSCRSLGPCRSFVSSSLLSTTLSSRVDHFVVYHFACSPSKIVRKKRIPIS